ncbi:hypothetical protein EDB86DRAFT_2768594, partial [Lactarius hatsudake]
FIHATGHDATTMLTCAVCAGLFFTTEVQPVELSHLREKKKLSPTIHHPAHVLTDGMLLERNNNLLGRYENGTPFTNVCRTCVCNLQNDKTPTLSLANGLWIGDIPPPLNILTLPERILVVRYFPAAYIVKLYPKKKGAHNWSSAGMQSGLRGNVSTYRLNTNNITHLTDMQIMPPSSAILAATIGITFVGPKNLPEKTMPGFLRVNRTRVRLALEWLKSNNPIYRDVIISSERLRKLPVDSVPMEIMSLARHSDDTVLLAEETDGYVPDDNDFENGTCISSLHLYVDTSHIFSRQTSSLWVNLTQNVNPSVIPLHSLGVVDVAANEVTENEILAHALANVARTEKVAGWAIKRGSDFVNEYACKDESGSFSDGSSENPNHLLGSFPCLFPYGLGGFEVDRPRKVSYQAHARWALRYTDKRFRKDLHFIFQVFGVLQKYPIVQVLCGEDINLDDFCATNQRPSDTAIAADPYAACLFFHLIINTILRSLLGITGFSSSGPIERETGILGKIAAYVGTVEAQGRGTLHLHMILWLCGSVTTEKMKELLATEQFRKALTSFISANIRAHIPDAPGVAVLSIPCERVVTFSRPVHPQTHEYEVSRADAEKRIARTVQVHQCSHVCMKISNSRLVCKRWAPFPLFANDWVDEHGNWGPKRTYTYLNNWCPAILQTVRTNHDIKLITNGIETKDIAWYITHYVAKKQRDSSNTSALLAKTLAYHWSNEQRNSALSAIHKKLIQQCANSLSRQQELSAPEVISYLMGWGDRFVSHHFEMIHWYSVVKLLTKTFPILQKRRYIYEQRPIKFPVLIQYIDRGDALERWSFLNFFLGTYDGVMLKPKKKFAGHKPNTCVPYRTGCNRDGHCRIVRSASHETMPYFPGLWFAKRDNTTENGLFKASMLALLKPWHSLSTLKTEEESFRHAFDKFMSHAANNVRTTVSNIKFFHQCSDSAR